MREQILSRIRALSTGLEPDGACVDRLLERLSAQDDGPELRALLVEMGAMAALERFRHEAEA
jgi:hypothetical protein